MNYSVNNDGSVTLETKTCSYELQELFELQKTVQAAIREVSSINYPDSLDIANNCLSIIYQLEALPSYVRTFNTGVQFALAPMNDHNFQLVFCVDGSIDLQLLYKNMTGLLLNGDATQIIGYLNDWIDSQQGTKFVKY